MNQGMNQRSGGGTDDVMNPKGTTLTSLIERSIGAGAEAGAGIGGTDQKDRGR